VLSRPGYHRFASSALSKTVREKLPEGFQRRYLLRCVVDMVVPRAELRATLSRVIALLRNQAPAPMDDGAKRSRPTPADADVEAVPTAAAAG
jgi:acetyl-CoA carboxylase carboxyl transferase subunit beta